MIRRVAILLGVASALVAFAGAAAPAAAQADRPELLNVSFEGNAAFPDDSLRLAIENRQTECRSRLFWPLCFAGIDTFVDRQFLLPRELPYDALRLERFYAERGYRSAEVDTALTQLEGGVGVTFEIDEGEPTLIDSLGFVGLEAVPEDRRSGIVSGLPISEGDPANAIRIDRARNLVISRLQNEGYAHAEVLIDQFIPADTRAATVEFVFDTGPEVRIGEVEVVGNRILDETSVRRMVPFEQGDLYRRSELEAGQRNLYSLDLVRTANVEVVQGEFLDTVLPIRISIREGDLHRVRTALGWSTSDCVNVEARWASRNFFGGARRLEVSARVSNILATQFNQNVCPQVGTGEFADLDGQAQVELVQPWIFSPRNSLSASAFVERQSLPDVFIREALGVNVALSRNLGPGMAATLSYQPQISRLEAAEIFFCSSFRACTEDDIGVFRSANWLAPLGLAFSLERVDQLLNPSDGYQVNVSVETASSLTLSDFAYRRATSAAAGYLDVGGSVLALRAAGGIVTEGEFFGLAEGDDGLGIIHPEKRLYSGGASSVRGYGENRLGPQVLSVQAARLLETREDGPAVCSPQEVFDGLCDAGLLPAEGFIARPTGGDRLLEANLEVRIPFDGNRFQVVPFVDAGQVWGPSESVGLSDIAVTPGIGFRYFSPVGPIRVDIGYRPDRTRSLQVISSGLRPYDPATDDPGDRIEVRGGNDMVEPIDWVATSDLIFLDPRVPFGIRSGFLDRLQLHISIGQAF